MTLAEQRFFRSELAVQEAGYVALIHSLGYTDALRFVAQLSAGQGDYLELQEHIFGDASVDAIYERAEKYWQDSKELDQEA
jgi:hypothetical protein